jgi:hypothetical protein
VLLGCVSITPCVTKLSFIMLTVTLLSVVVLSAIILSVTRPFVYMLCVIVLSVATS